MVSTNGKIHKIGISINPHHRLIDINAEWKSDNVSFKLVEYFVGKCINVDDEWNLKSVMKKYFKLLPKRNEYFYDDPKISEIFKDFIGRMENVYYVNCLENSLFHPTRIIKSQITNDSILIDEDDSNYL